jgi:S-adenosyl-L-methionine hydrolase (adenosine-forming)
LAATCGGHNEPGVTLITLLTDFGLNDTYVGQLKGAILSVAPSAVLVDLTHGVEAQDVLGGAFLLWSSVEVFPPGSIHVAVVDPGVGSPRRAIAARTVRAHVFVGPDNGVLFPAIDRLGGVAHAVELTDTRFWRAAPSGTFHGRDIFGPVAGHLAGGVSLEQLGPPIDHLAHLRWPEPRGLEGEVIYVDTYGNLVTNLPASALPARYAVRVNDQVVPAAQYYAAVEPGKLLALVGSAGLLEISARDASAAALTGGHRGTPVEVVRR